MIHKLTVKGYFSKYLKYLTVTRHVMRPIAHSSNRISTHSLDIVVEIAAERNFSYMGSSFIIKDLKGDLVFYPVAYSSNRISTHN